MIHENGVFGVKFDDMHSSGKQQRSILHLIAIYIPGILENDV